LLVVFVGTGFAQRRVEFVRPLQTDPQILTVRQGKIFERELERFFPIRSLQRTAIGEGTISGERITYKLLKQRREKYAVVIFSGSWRSEASQLGIFRIEAGGYPTPVYRSHNWRSNYTDTYHEIQSISLGKDNIILIKEGEMGQSRFVVSSIFSFREKRGDDIHRGYCTINDITPAMPRLKAHVGFPLKALYAQAVQLEKHEALPHDYITLQAGDVEFTWENNSAGNGLVHWQYDRTSRSFLQVYSGVADLMNQ
jgi:hypothetical protein